MADRADERLPCYRGEMLLLKYLESVWPSNAEWSTIPHDFEKFVAPIDGTIPRARERVYGYIDILQREGLAKVVVSNGDPQEVEVTEVGLLNARKIGLDPTLRPS